MFVLKDDFNVFTVGRDIQDISIFAFMKRIIAIIALALLTGQIVVAQNEISFSYGIGSFNHLMGTMLGIANLHGQDFDFDTRNVNSTSSGALNLEYLRYLGDMEIWAVGVSFMINKEENQKGTKTLPAFQINPACVEFGGESVKGFLELGWGSQSLSQLGVRYCF